MEDVKIKLAALWFFDTIVTLIIMTNAIYAPGVIDDIRTGELFGEALTGEYLLMSALFLLFPLVMALLSLVLKDKINRWVNIIVGILAAILNIATFSQALTLDLSIYAYAIPMDISMILASALVVWFAWKWPKQE